MLLFLLVFAAMTSLLFLCPPLFPLRWKRRHAVNVMVNDPFSDLPFFLVVKKTYDPRSQIHFWILLKIRSLKERFHASLPSHFQSFVFLKQLWPWPFAISDRWISIRLVCFCVLRSIACVLLVSGYIIYYFTLKIFTDLVIAEQPWCSQAS